jgi:hypothetical protein
MAKQLFFSRETKVYVQPTNPINVKISATAAYVGGDTGVAKTNILLTSASSKKVTIGDELFLGTLSLGRVTAATSRAGTDTTFTVTGAAAADVSASSTGGAVNTAVTVSRPVFEIPVLDGYSFSQSTNTSEVTVAEMADSSGDSTRGRKQFTDNFAPAEWSFSTYARPYERESSKAIGEKHSTDDTYYRGGSTTVHACEEVLWALWAGEGIISDTDGGAHYTSDTSAAAATKYITSANDKLTVDFSQSNKVALGTATVYFVLGASDSSTSHADLQTSAAVTLASQTEDDEVAIAIDAGNGNYQSSAGHGVQIGDIGRVAGSTSNNNDLRVTAVTATTITVTGFNATIGDNTKITFTRQLGYKIDECVVNEAGFEFDIDGIATINWSGIGKSIEECAPPVPTINEGTTLTTNMIRNRLTTLTAKSSLGASTTLEYDGLVLTGGSISFSNNATFITPAELGKVNLPLKHVTGNRSISGSFTCYLNTANNAGAELFETLLGATSTITNQFDLTFGVGGKTGDSLPTVQVKMPSCHLELPTHSIEDVISLEANFHALPSNIMSTDEATIEYSTT